MLEINKKGISIEKLFVVIGLIVGCMFIYIIPPFQSPDEDSHFKKAYSIANGNLYAKSENKTIGLEIPEAMNDYINNKLSMMGNRELKYSYNDFYYDQYLTNDLSKTSFYRVSTSETSPIAHLIPGIGILIAKLFGLVFFKGNPSIAFMLSFARFFSLLSYLMIGYFAIKLTPVFKKSFFAVLLMPMSIFLGSMVTYDNLLISITALAVASILKLTYDKKEKFNNKWFIIFAVIGYILLNVKVIYAPILGLMLFIPNERFKNKDINIINARYIKPIDKTILKELIETKQRIYVYETCIRTNSLGTNILEYFNYKNAKNEVKLTGIDNTYVKHGKTNILKQQIKLDIDYIEQDIINYLKLKK